MKRFVALLLATLVMLCLTQAGAEDAATTAEPTSVTIGVTTQMSGYFFTDMWGNNTVDTDIRAMLHGYGTVVWKSAGEYGVDDRVVTDFSATDGKDGRTYTLTLADDLTYNDGTPVTAADYVFAILLQSDPCLAQLGASNTNYAQLVGYDDYVSGASGVFAGVRLLSASQFSLTVPESALPYFYELTYAAVEPCPINEIAPGYMVRDDGQGAYLAKAEAKEAAVPTALTQQLLSTTLTAANGYLHCPKVTCGPYQLEKYDAADSTASFVINPRYKGNYEGQKLTIERVTVRQISSEQAVEAYQNGEVQVLHKLSDGAAIDAAQALLASGEAGATNYLRSGYAFLAFACEHEPTADVNVRQAVALCIDRNSLVNDVFHGYGLAVNGYYGYGQWMAAQHMAELVQFDIGYNLDAARALLEQAGYLYNEQGTEFAAGEGQIRCKVKDGTLTPLELKWAKAKSTAADALQKQLTSAFETLGIRLVVNEVPFTELLGEYYRLGGERDNDLFFLADNFFHVFDPYYTYNTGDRWQGVFNTSGLKDEALMNAAEAMRRVSGDDIDTYFAQWLVFQQRWHEMMPTAPIYSNVYYDVFIPQLQNYAPAAQSGFGTAILYATFQTAEQQTDSPSEDSQDDIVIVD